MAACPYCKMIDGGFLNGYYARCTSPKNPGNSKKGDCTPNGVSFARCRDGKEFQGMTYKQCPFMKQGTKSTRKKK